MPSKKIEKAINQQIQSEFYSSHLYLSMAAYCEGENLSGFASWMRAQSEEEREHALRLFEYLGNRGSRVILESVEKPPCEFKSPLKMFEQALGHEQKMTRMIHELFELARSEKDYATEVALEWFITEQVEEEKSVSDILDRLRLIADQPAALLMLDRQLGARGEH